MRFVNIETELVSYLSAALSRPVSTRVPNPRPARFVQLRRSGGSATLENGEAADVFRDKPMVDFWSWSDDEDDAMNTAFALRGLMLSLPRSGALSAPCDTVEEFLGPTKDDDTVPGTPVTHKVWLTYSVSTRILEVA